MYKTAKELRNKQTGKKWWSPVEAVPNRDFRSECSLSSLRADARPLILPAGMVVMEESTLTSCRDRCFNF